MLMGLLNLWRNKSDLGDSYTTMNDILQFLAMVFSPFWTINMGISTITFVDTIIDGQ